MNVQGAAAMKTSWTVIALAAIFANAPAWGQAYPTKVVRIIAPFAPGGGTDFIARIAAQKLTEATRQQFIVENRPGAGGSIGVEVTVKSPADGYTFCIIATSYTVNPGIYKLAFDSASDITPVIQMSQGPLIVATHPSLPAKNIKEFIALARAKPESLNFATSGAGSIVHLGTEYFLETAKIKATHVPYKGTGPALTDTIAGHTQFLFGSPAVTIPHLKSGRLRGIAVTTPQRIKSAPELPTISESGYKDFAVILWHGLIGPRNLPRSVVERVNGELNKALKSRDMEEKLQTDGVEPKGGTPEEFLAVIKADLQRWVPTARRLGIKPS
jgi:tripartite-type tricarboxylate transporter receptor subunit TctC